MSESAEARITRLLTMVPWLMANSGVTVTQAARHFDISDEQMLRDLKLLIGVGRDDFIDIWFWREEDIQEADSDVRDDPSAVISVHNPQGFDRPLKFSDGEVATLTTQLQLLHATYGHYSPAFGTVMEKFLVLYGINRPTPTGDALKNPRRTPLDTFRDAIQDGLCVDMRYASDSRDEVTERTIQPVRISNVADLIYVEGWTLGSTDTALKRYRIDRVVGCKISDEEPSGLERIDVEPREPRPTSGMQLRVAIAAGNAWLLDEHVFHDVLHNEDGSVSASMYVGDSHDYAVRWGLQYAGFATILEPATVAEEVRQQAREALAMYAEGVTAGNR